MFEKSTKDQSVTLTCKKDAVYNLIACRVDTIRYLINHLKNNDGNTGSKKTFSGTES